MAYTAQDLQDMAAGLYNVGNAVGVDLSAWERAGAGNMAMALADQGLSAGWNYDDFVSHIQLLAGTEPRGRTPGAGATATAPDAPTTDATALGILKSYLNNLGLGELADWAYNQGVVESGTLDQERLLVLLQDQPAYQRRFVGNQIRRQNGYSTLTPADYLQVEDAYRTLMQNAQLPAGFYDNPDDFAQWIGRDVSVTELGQRITDGYIAAAQADPTVRAELRNFYGIDEGGLAAYYLDPNRAVSSLVRQLNAARIGSSARLTGFGALTAGEAEGLVGLGVTDQQASQGLGQLADQRQLFTPINQGEDTISREEQLAATFQGSAPALQRIRQRQRRRLAEFQGGGGYAASREGLAGLGTTSR